MIGCNGFYGFRNWRSRFYFTLMSRLRLSWKFWTFREGSPRWLAACAPQSVSEAYLREWMLKFIILFLSDCFLSCAWLIVLPSSNESYMCSASNSWEAFSGVRRPPPSFQRED